MSLISLFSFKLIGVVFQTNEKLIEHLWAPNLHFLTTERLDMARYKVQKGPMCQTCVPVPLCRKIFGGKAHRLHVFFVAYDFVYEVFNVMYIFFCVIYG